MATTVLSDIPTEITAGDSVAWKRFFSDYRADNGWSLVYALVLLASTSAQIKITAASDGADHLIEESATDTSSWTPGRYRYEAYVKKDAERIRVDFGDVEILPDFEAASNGYDARTPNEVILDALEATQAGRATEAESSIAIGGRQISLLNPRELREEIEAFRGKVKQERDLRRVRQGRSIGKTIKVQFN